MSRAVSISTLTEEEVTRVEKLEEKYRYLVDGYNMASAVIEDFLCAEVIDPTVKSSLYEQILYVRNYLIDYFSNIDATKDKQ